jgi:diadenosine tetraphosphatase ApaH/serine/threonine PP2A family protein phosphatase
MFKSVIKKFDEYLNKMEAENPVGFNSDLWTEANKRLEQLQWLYNHIFRKHSRLMDLNWRENRRIERLRKDLQLTSGSITLQRSAESRKIDRLMFEIEMFTESFYYLAARMRTLLGHGPLPGLRSFECEGARNVRNKLLEHPERESQVFSQSFRVGGEEGPTLKTNRAPGQETVFPDAGLWTNAAEIKNNLEKLLDRVLAS